MFGVDFVEKYKSPLLGRSRTSKSFS